MQNAFNAGTGVCYLCQPGVFTAWLCRDDECLDADRKRRHAMGAPGLNAVRLLIMFKANRIH